MVALIQPSFAAGEVSPELYGRVDQSLYYIGLRKARNMIVSESGGIYNRPGLRYIGNVKNHDQGARLILFKFSAEDNYILEFGDKYIRFIRNDEHITHAGVSITGVTKGSTTVVSASSHGLTTDDDVFVSGVSGMPEINNRWFNVRKY